MLPAREELLGDRPQKPFLGAEVPEDRAAADSRCVGDLLYRITADSFAVQTMIMNGVLPILSAAVLLGGMLVVLLPLDPTLTLLSLTVVPLLFALIFGFNRKIVDVATEVRTTESRVYSLVQWGMSAIKLVQAFTKEEEEHQRFMGASRASLRATLDRKSVV